jgi:hypothetical protein
MPQPIPFPAARNYLIALAAMFFGGTLVIMGLLWLADPFAIYRPPVLAAFNAEKPAEVVKLLGRRFKPGDIAREKPQFLILGTSRAERGFDMDDPWLGPGWYNASLNEGTPYEALRLLQHANAINPVRHVVILINLKEYSDSDLRKRSDFPDDRLAVDAQTNVQHFAPLATMEDALLGWTSLEWGWRTVMVNDHVQDGPALPIDAIYHHGGLTEQGWKASQTFTGHRQMFHWIETAGIMPFYQGMSRDPLRIMDSPGWHAFTALLACCRDHGIAIDVAFAPEHARALYLIHATGLWPDLEAWKSAVVEAVRQGPPTWTLWDFSAVNEIAEALPPADDTSESMLYWRDTLHFRPLLGHRILAAVLGHQPGWGHQITADDDLAAWQQTVRTDLAAWVAAHPAEVVEVDQEAEGSQLDVKNAAKF